MVEDLLGRGPVLGVVLQALSDQFLHVRPWCTAVMLNVRNGMSLHRGLEGAGEGGGGQRGAMCKVHASSLLGPPPQMHSDTPTHLLHRPVHLKGPCELLKGTVSIGQEVEEEESIGEHVNLLIIRDVAEPCLQLLWCLAAHCPCIDNEPTSCGIAGYAIVRDLDIDLVDKRECVL